MGYYVYIEMKENCGRKEKNAEKEGERKITVVINAE